MAYQFKKSNVTDESGDFSPTPEGYTHRAMSKAIDAVDTSISNNQTIPDAITHLILRVDMLERICRARKLLDENNEKGYAAAIQAYNPEEKNEIIKKGMIANFKLQKLMEMVFQTTQKDKEIIF